MRAGVAWLGAALGLLCACAAACSGEDALPCGGRLVLCTVAGDGEGAQGSLGVPMAQASLYQPMDVSFDSGGAAYLVDWNNHRVLRVGTDGRVQAWLGNGAIGEQLPVGKASEVAVYHPTDVVFRQGGGAYVALWHNDVIVGVDLQGQLTSVVGTGDVGYAPDGEVAATAAVYLPSKLAMRPDGRLCFSEAGNQRVRCVDAEGNLTTLVGPATGPACVGEGCVGKLLAPGFGGDGGPAQAAALALPHGNSAVPSGGLGFQPDGTLLLADTLNHRVRRVDSAGTISTVAGGGAGQAPEIGDGGPATAATLLRPSDVAVDGAGRIYIADTYHHCVRRVDGDGVISTLAGRCGHSGDGGDGGPATMGLLNKPYGVAVDAAQRLWIADTLNHKIRRVELD